MERGAVGVAQRDDELGPAVVAGADGRRLDDGSAVVVVTAAAPCRRGRSGSMPPGASIVGARSTRCGFQREQLRPAVVVAGQHAVGDRLQRVAGDRERERPRHELVARLLCHGR